MCNLDSCSVLFSFFVFTFLSVSRHQKGQPVCLEILLKQKLEATIERL